MKLRSIVLVPAGGNLDGALASEADAVAVTVADANYSVVELRDLAAASLSRVAAAGKRALVVINHPRTRLMRDDLDALVSPDLAGVVLRC